MTDETLPGDAAPTSAEASEPERGEIVGRYVVLDRLGVGGMGVVLAAYDPELDRKVAIKLVLPRGVGAEGTDARARLVREAQALAKLAHPNVVTVHDVGMIGERVFVAMEFVEGQTLDAWVEAHSRGWRATLDVLLRAGRGLAVAHATGLVHRDVKPANVMVSADGRVRVMDFGLAHAEEAPPSTIDMLAEGPPNRLMGRLTRSGRIMGTPAYMAPEQHSGEATDARTDQFGWCVMAWESLYGERPFGGKTPAELAFNVTEGKRRAPPPGSRVPGWVRRVIERGLEIDPARRWDSLEALLQALERDPTWRRRALLSVGAIAAFGVGALGWQQLQRNRVAASCVAEGELVADVWNADVAAKLGDAFAETGISYAADTWARAQTQLDDYTTAWRDARRRACERGEIEHSWSAEISDAARACLDERLWELDALLLEVATPTDSAVERIARTASTLAPVEPCGDEASLARRVSNPDPANGGEFGRLSRELTASWAARAAGSSDKALKIAQAVLEAAHDMGSTSLSARARLAIGAALEQLARYDEARNQIEQAFYEAGGSGRDDLALSAATRLTLVVGDRHGDTEEGLHWGHLGEMLVLRLELDDQFDAAHLRSNIGSVQYRSGALAESLASHREALDTGERLFGPDSIFVATALNNIAAVHATLGQHAEALAAFERSLEIRVAVLGAEHPRTATILGNISSVHHALGAYGQALAAQKRALAIREQAFGTSHPAVARSLNNVGGMQLTMGDYEEARKSHTRALEIREQVLKPNHPDLAMTLCNLGVTHIELGDPHLARSLYRRALAIQREVLPAEHQDLAVTLLNLGIAETEMRLLDEALANLTVAVGMFEKTLGPEHAKVGDALAYLGRTHSRGNSPDLALAMFRRALAIRTNALGPGHPNVGESHTQIGNVLLRAGSHAQAADAYENALEIYLRSEARPGLTADARLGLARALWPTKTNRPRAIELATAARDSFRDLGESKAASLAEAQAWLDAHEKPGR